jgi:EAL domain-containing protein (putative c-di-GMP-specific phosphodiesterase class I)
MRDLRTVSPADPDAAGDGSVDGRATVLDRGRAPDEQTFLASLGHVLATAADDDLRVLAFRARGRPVRLHRWSEPTLPSSEEVQAGIEARLLDVDPSIVTLRLAGDVIGFASVPCSRREAEQLGGALFAAIAHVVGDPGPRVAISPRLAVAIEEGPDRGVAQLASAVAETIEAVDRTLAQTTTDTPYLVHNDYLRNRARRQRRIGHALPQGLAERQVTLEFQPRVRVDDLTHVGLEVFPRWCHPQMGQIPTIELLRAAEREGHLGQLGRTVRSDAVAMAHRWATEGTLGDRRLWFDVTPVELLEGGFLDDITDIVQSTRLVSIGLELADGALLDDALFAPIFDGLEELGLEVAIDDFRPSMMSMARIQRLPVTMVILDRTLVHNMVGDASSRNLVRAICGYAEERSVLVTACEVDGDDELALAAELGIDLVQGLAVSKPLAESDVWPLLDRSGR